MEIDYDDFWQKYSKVSRIEFACFGFHVGLLFINFLADRTNSRAYATVLRLSVVCLSSVRL